MPFYPKKRRRNYLKRKRSAKKRSSAKKRFGRNTLLRYVNSAYQMPHIWKLRYVDSVTITTGALGGMNWHAFAANDIYDPNVTGTGHQPMLHDQLAVFWNRYTVLGSKIRVRAINANSTSSYPTSQYVGVVLDDNNTLASATSQALIENGKGATKIINANPYTSTASTNISYRFSAKKFFGKKNIVDDDFLSAAFGNSPANLAYFLIWTETPSTAGSYAMSFEVTIDYIVRCHEPKDIAQS